MNTNFSSEFLSLSREVHLAFDEAGCLLEAFGPLTTDRQSPATVLRGRIFWDLIESETEQNRLRETLETLKSGVLNSQRKEIGFGVTLKLPDGGEFPASARATYRPDQKIYLLALERTRKTAAQSEHFVDQSLLHEIIETTPSVIVAKDVDGRCILANKKFRQIFNLRPEQILGHTAHELFPPPIADKLRANDLRVIRSVKHETSFETVRHADGTFGRYFSEKFPLLNSQGEVVGTTTISTDVTELEDAEKRVREKQELLEHILDNMPMVIAGKSVQGNFPVVMWNKDAERLLGVSREAALGKCDSDLLSAEQAQRSREQDLEALQKNLPVDVPEYQVETPSGSRWLHTIKHCIRDDKQTPVLLLTVSVDITERKRQEALIQEQNAKIAASTKMVALGEMAGGLAHEVKNPLAIIKSIAEEIRELTGEDPVNRGLVTDLSAKLNQHVERVAVVIEGLRQFSRDGSRDPIESVNLADVVTRTLSFCHERLREQGTELLVDEWPPQLTFAGRATEISQVLLSLINNAQEAVAGLAKPWIRISVTQTEDWIELQVTDSGPGIPPDIREKIFQPFFTTKAIGSGMGTGLSISLGIVQEQGGDLRLDSRCPHTRFAVRLPIQTKTDEG
jgi:PAS domain S-box-containing protein